MENGRTVCSDSCASTYQNASGSPVCSGWCWVWVNGLKRQLLTSGRFGSCVPSDGLPLLRGLTFKEDVEETRRHTRARMAHRPKDAGIMRSKGLLRVLFWMRLIATLAWCVDGFGLPEAHAKEFWFEAQELEKEKGVFEGGETEIWLPPSVAIDQKEDLNEPLWFVVQNPTGIDHEFAVRGLFMLVPEEEAIPEIKLDPASAGLLPRNIRLPLHIKVKSGETRRVQVAPRGLVGEENLGARYRFFCPKHKDIRISRFIYVD